MRICTPILLAASLIALGGCAGSDGRVRGGPDRPAALRTGEWSFGGEPGRRVVSDHYVIYTTIEDEELVGDVAQVMEGALSQYRTLVPDLSVSQRPMECYLFRYRNEWAQFTERRTGADAAVYLQIRSGGYTVRDWYVSYFIGDLQTYSVAAHEGWHQFVARHFKQRPPPFLEEGLACLFEDVEWDGRLPRWDLSHNSKRIAGLRNAIEAETLWPLTKLVSMHAGQIVDQPLARIEAFYAQSWGFARFLRDGEGGRYRQGLQRLLSDAAAGELYVSRTHGTTGGEWDPRVAGPLLERYLGTDLDTLERQYLEFIRQYRDRGRRSIDS